MVKVTRHGIILEPTRNDFEAKGVFNPACIRKGKYVHMYYRAWDENNKSTIGYARLDGPLKVIERRSKPMLFQEKENEFGLEDPRIVCINGTYYLTYIAYDGKNVRIAYATSRNLKKFTKKGILSPDITYDEAEDYFRTHKEKLKERYFLFESYFKDIAGKDVLLWSKDAFFFPRKIGGKFALVHRILPDIQVIYFKNFKELTLDYWKKYLTRLSDNVILESKNWFESRNIGGGCPPIETERGWLMLYHAVDDMNSGKIYRTGAALLDKKNPTKEIGRLKEPLLSPEEEWEQKGNVDNVVFPTGSAIFEDRLYVYYGAADTRIGIFSVVLKDLINELSGR